MFKRSWGFGIARIGISLLILKDFFLYLKYSQIFYGSSAIVPYDSYLASLRSLNLTIFSLPFNQPIFTNVFIVIGIISCLIFLSGIWTVASGLLLSFVLFELNLRNIFIIDGGDNVIYVALPFLALSYSKSFFNIKSINIPLNTVNRARRRVVNLIASYGLLIQICIVYFFAAFSKVLQPIWRNGTALYYTLRNVEFVGSSFNMLLAHNSIFVYFITTITLAWEFLFPFAVWFKKIRIPIILFSAMMHFGILFFMRIDNYSIIMVVLYFAFIENEQYKKIRSDLQSSFIKVSNYFIK